MLSILTLATLLLSVGSNDAAAAQNELSLELGSIGTSDERFELFHERNLLASYGARLGYAVHPRVGIVAGYHYATAGNTVESEGSYTDYEAENDYGSGTFQAAYRGHHLQLGPKVDFPVDDWGFPYATLQGALFIGQVLLDEDMDDDENINQLKATSVNPGGIAAVGIDIVPLHLPNGRLSFGGHLELGYGLTAATGFTADLPTGTNSDAEIARFGLGGFYLRTGLGIYF